MKQLVLVCYCYQCHLSVAERSVTREQEELLRDFEKEVQTLLTEREKEATEKEEAL